MLRAALAVTLLTASAHAQPTPQSPARSPWSLYDALGAPDRLKLSGTHRIRFEAMAGQPRPGFYDDDTLLVLRTTLFSEYEPGGGVQFGAELWDSRAYLESERTPLSANEVNVAELVQAYVALNVKDLFGPGSRARVKAGRQTINFGSRRLVAANEYRNATNSFNGLRLDVSTAAGFDMTAAAALPLARLPDDPSAVRADDYDLDQESFDNVFWGVIAGHNGLISRARLEFTYVGLSEKDAPGRPTRDRALHTIGGRILRDPAPGKADFEVEGFRQFGRASPSATPGAPLLDVSAGFFRAQAGYSFRSPLKPRVTVFYDLVSGDGPGAGYGRFDTLFGVRRIDFAPSGLYGAVARANLSAPGARLEIQPSRRLDAFLHYRALWLAARTDSFSTSGVRDQSGASGAFAGHQIEFRVRRWLVQDALRAELNGVYLVKGRFLRTAPNAPDNDDTRYGSFAVTAFF